MRIWGVFCFVGCISYLHAKSDNVPDMPDEKPVSGIIAHIEEEALPEEDSDEQKADLSSFLKEASDTLTLSQEELEKPESFLIVTTEQSSPTGGGVRFIDPKIEKMLPSLTDSPWWERWWNAINSWFSDESSDK